MKKLIVSALAVCAVLSAFSDGEKKYKNLKERLVWEKRGGYVERPDKRLGKFAVVNAQKLIKADTLPQSLKEIQDTLHAKIDVLESEAVTPKNATAAVKKLGLAGAVFLVECKECENMSLISPEGRWAIVNTAPLAADGKGEAFYQARLKKETIRAIILLCSSAARGVDLFDAITKPEELDKVGRENWTVESISRARYFLERLDVETRPQATYLDACKEGWAAAPTNDAQKAVWNRVHKIPENPIKIKFDPKRDAGK